MLTAKEARYQTDNKQDAGRLTDLINSVVKETINQGKYTGIIECDNKTDARHIAAILLDYGYNATLYEQRYATGILLKPSSFSISFEF